MNAPVVMQFTGPRGPAGSSGLGAALASVAEMQALQDQPDSVFVQSYHGDPGGRGGGWFIWDPTSIATPDGGVVIQPSVGLGRWIRVFIGNLDICMWGCKASGVDTGSDYTGDVDNSAGLQAAVDFSNANRITIAVLNGDYFFDANDPAGTDAGKIDVGNWFSLQGESREGTRFLIKELLNVHGLQYHYFFNSGDSVAPFSKTVRELFRLSNITLKGSWSHAYGTMDNPALNSPDVTGRGVGGGQITQYAQVILDHVALMDMRNKGMIFEHCDRFEASQIVGLRCSNGFLRPFECNYCTIRGLWGMWGDDDATDPHADNDNSSGIVRHTLILSDFILMGCEGITFNGAKHATLNNISTFLTHGSTLQIGNGNEVGLSGDTPPFNIQLSNINVIDPIERFNVGTVVGGVDSGAMGTLNTLHGAVELAGEWPSGDQTSNIPPGDYSPIEGAFLDYWTKAGSVGPIGAMWGNPTWSTTGAGKSGPAAHGWNVSNITVQRTLPDAVKYSDWGFGKMFTRNGWKDPAITANNRKAHGIVVHGTISGLVMTNINVRGMPRAAIQFYVGVEGNDDDAIALSQSPGAAGNLTLNGLYASGGVATMDRGRKFSVTSGGNDTGKTVTVTGTDKTGVFAQTEVLSLGNATVVTSLKYWKTITQVAISAASAGTIKVGSYKAINDRQRAYRDVVISDFVFKNCRNGVLKDYSANTQPFSECDNWTISFFDGVMDLDPLEQASGRNTDGSWDLDNATSDYRGFAMKNWKGGRVANVTFKNCYAPFDSNIFVDTANLKVQCNPVATAFNTANLGVAIPGSGAEFLHEIIDCDRTSLTYGNVLNICPRTAAAMPTSGTFVQDHFVALTGQALAGGKVLKGYTRLTTGSAHVLNTDWAGQYAPNS